MTITDSYPFSQMYDCIVSLSESKVFTTLGAYNIYCHVYIAPQDSHKTSFFYHTGTYQYIQMSVGLTNAPASYQCAQDIIPTMV